MSSLLTSMKCSAIIILFVALAAAKPREQVEVNSAGCPFDDSELLLPHKYCNRFYQCVRGTPVVQSCPSDLLFNIENNVCDWPADVNCNDRALPENKPEIEESDEVLVEEPINNGHSDPSLAPEICTAEGSEGVLVAHEHCNVFYVCHIGQPTALPCPENLLYNPENEQCDWPQNVQCGTRVTEVIKKTQSSICDSEGLQGALLAHENCNRFIKCDSGKSVAFDCPAGLMFNAESLECDWASNVECGERTIAVIEEGSQENDGAWTPAHGNSDPSQAPAICAAADSDSVLVAHENCNQFYKCYRGAPVALDCPPLLLYNPALEICDWPQNVDCGNRNP